MKRLIIIILLGLTALLLTACSAEQPVTPDADGNITITMTDFRFTPDNIQLKVGQEVTITLINQGDKDHELMAGRMLDVDGGETVGFQEDMFAGMEPMVMMGGMPMEEMEGMEMGDDEPHANAFMVLVPESGESASISFTVTEDMVGEWEIACFQGNGSHYDDGMRGKIAITP